QDFIHGIRSLLDLDARDHALVAAAAVEAIQPPRGDAHEVDLGALRHGSQVLRARVVAGLIEIDLQHRRGISTQPREHGVEAEYDAGLAVSLAAHLLSLAAAWSSSSGNSKSKREITASPSRLWWRSSWSSFRRTSPRWRLLESLTTNWPVRWWS